MNNIVRESSAEIRGIARTALKGNWGGIFLGVFVYYVLLTTVPSVMAYLLPNAAMNIYVDEIDQYVTVSYVANLYDMLISGALTVGVYSFFLTFFRKKETHPGHLFNGFEHFFKSLGLMILYTVIVMLCSLLFVIPGIIAAFALSQSFMIMADHPEKGIVDCLRESNQMMKGNKGKLFCLSLSFIGWVILASLLVGILAAISALMTSGFYGVINAFADLIFSLPLVVLSGYIMTARTVFYELASGNLQAKPEFREEDYHF